jgi:energy-coupling factor transport system substrate-specific component
MTPIVSNFFLGHGPWTIYQMLAWGLIGAGAPLLRRFGNSRIGLAVSGAIAGYFFGWIMNLWYVSIAVPTIQGYIAANIASLWFDTFHAIGNVVFLYLLGTRTVTLLERFKKRFRVYMPAKGMNEGLG